MYKIVSKKDYHGVKIVDRKTGKTITSHDSFRRNVDLKGKKRAVSSLFKRHPSLDKHTFLAFVMKILLLRRERALLRMLKGKMDDKRHAEERRVWQSIHRMVMRP